MTLAILLSPHSNARYFDSLRALSLCELKIILKQHPGLAEPEYREINGLELLCLDMEGEAAQSADQILRILSRHSSCMAVFRVEGEALYPLRLIKDFPFPDDIAGILKYKGKTNERFTQLLLNAAVFSSAYHDSFDQPLSIFDPMCGRGTTLFQALRSGYEASGVEIEKSDAAELVAFMSRYLEFHKRKHEKEKGSMTANGKSAGERTIFRTGGQSLTVVRGNTLDSGAFYKPGTFHCVVSDLPYGIQHAGYTGKKRAQIDALMKRALPLWRTLLMPGGAIALSFNAHSISLNAMRDMLAEAGYTPLTGDAYDGMRHWVEQAVDRDIAVATV